ncbi:MAG: TrbC/VirB2 family protein [Clostridia bacterium]|nr:TrbC/VirB2 family protein [Clostridia bacterium]
MKKIIKLLPILIIMIMLFSTVSVVFAATNPSDLKGTATNSFDTMGKRIIGMVQAIGSIASVLVLVILGIKYMMGSAEEKAEYKKTFIPYLIGAILVFAASNLASMIFGFADTLTNS